MNGLGFLIWQVSKCPIETTISLLKRAKARWVSIKVADGANSFNTSGGNDKPLVAYIDALVSAGIEVGGWHYVYPDNAGPCGDRAEERREKLGLAHYLLDVEGEWRQPYGMPKAAKLLLSKLHKGNFEVALCSYRFPSFQPEVPWNAFAVHEAMDAMAPQVYWASAHNPAEQLEKSFSEYSQLTTKPFIPIGATFGASFGSNTLAVAAAAGLVIPENITIGAFEKQQTPLAQSIHQSMASSYWEPTVEDLKTFVAWCKAKGAGDRGVKAFGFYSLDWIIQHGRTDWIDAITGNDVTPTPDPEPEPGEIIKPLWTGQVTGDLLNVRNQADPAIVPATDIGDLIKGSKVPVVEERGEWARLEGWVKKSLLKKV